MKFKNKTNFGIVSGILTASAAISLIPLALTTNNVVLSSSNAEQNSLLSNQSNGSYVTVTFTSEESDVTFEGNTTIKMKAGKTFATMIPPKASKPNGEFLYWYFYNGSTKTKIASDTVISEDMEIYPYFQIQSSKTVTFHSTWIDEYLNLQDKIETSVFRSGLTFYDIDKPTPEICKLPGENYYFKFVGWYDEPWEGPGMPETTSPVNLDRVLNNDCDVYAHYQDMNGDFGETLDITALEDSSITLQIEGSWVDVSVPETWFMLDNDTTQTYKWTSDTSVTLEKGHTLSIWASGKDPEGLLLPYSVTDQDYQHFNITGSVMLSGTLEALIDGGVVSTTIDNLTTLSGSGSYCYYSLFSNNGHRDSKDKIYISKDINSQTRALFPATNLSEHCYEKMFYNCPALDGIPCRLFGDPMHLSTCIATKYSFAEMFEGCINITSIPDHFLPIIGKPNDNYAYYSMFKNCENLLSIPNKLVVTRRDTSGVPQGTAMSQYCFASIFENCYSIKTVPEGLFWDPITEVNPFTTWGRYGCSSMFKNCISLTDIYLRLPVPSVTGKYIITEEAFRSMFDGCSNVKYITPSLFCELLDLKAFTSSKYCLSRMFYGMNKITITQDDEKAGELFFPCSPNKEFEGAFLDMFTGCNCVGFNGTPEMGHSYYISFN